MDPALAALVGAGIGAVAAIAAGIIGPLLIERRRHHAALRDAQRQEIGATLDVLAELLRARHVKTRKAEFFRLHTAAVVATTRLKLLVTNRDHAAIARVLTFTLETVSGDKAETNLDLALTSATYVLEDWYLGKLHGKKITDEYERLISRDLSAFTRPS